jgi:integrase
MSIRETPDPDDPVEYFVEHLRSTGKAEGTIKKYQRAFRYLREYLESVGLQPGEATDQHCIELISQMRTQMSATTATSYAHNINRFYQFFSNRGTFETNPMAVALDDVELSRDTGSHRREISVDEMREFIRQVSDPQTFSIVVLFAKTGIRRGELANLDRHDLHIDHPGAKRVLPTPRSEISDRPDSLFISSDIGVGDVVRGEVRETGNKRKCDTIVPLDGELKQTLLMLIAVSTPSPNEFEPLFRIYSGSRRSPVPGERITGGSINSNLQTVAESYGWYEVGAGVQSNVTPHYFRHWFTTMAERHGLERSLIKYIRGDVGNDIVDTYRHFWGDEVRDGYSKNIYRLFPS